MTTHHTSHPHARPRLIPEGGFTLVEMLVAIGAVALLAVGIAQVFSATGKTVAAGRRLSYLNAQAGLLERQMRGDFEAMTRDGFLVIRNQYANNSGFAPGNTNPAPVQLNPDDLSPRARRVDEIAFFARGNFRSLRDVRHPDRVAEATSARIYYGHGQRRDPLNREPGAGGGTSGFDYPVNLKDDNHLAGRLGEATQGNANRYAQDWILARQVTLLSPPANSLQTVRDIENPDQPTRLEDPDEHDNLYQIAWQPAAASVFRSVNGDDTRTNNLAPNAPPGAPANWLYRNSVRNDGVRPLFASGAVDIASTDLTQIRNYVLFDDTITTEVNGLEVAAGNTAAAERTAQRQAEWMINAFPAGSDGGRRIRVEPSPPNILGIGQGWSQIRTDTEEMQAARTDQQMLAASSFLERCTEFTVEWSFGNIDYSTGPYQTGRMLWFGLDRAVDVDGDGAAEYLVKPYGYSTGIDLSEQAYARRDGSTGFVTIPPDLIHPALASINTGTNNTSLGFYSCFGYINPYYSPQLSGSYPVLVVNGNSTTTRQVPAVIYGRQKQPDRGNTAGTNPSAIYDPAYGDVLQEPQSIPWPWPALIRVTVSLADPTDPKIERTFQFIFKTPGQTTPDSPQ